MGFLFFDSPGADSEIMKAIDSVIEPVRENGVTAAQLERARTKLRSDFYNSVDTGFGRADLLASFALFDDRPQRINELEREFSAVDGALIRKTASEYLRPTNRTVLEVAPAAAPTPQKGEN
jgi:zinc protease